MNLAVRGFGGSWLRPVGGIRNAIGHLGLVGGRMLARSGCIVVSEEVRSRAFSGSCKNFGECESGGGI